MGAEARTRRERKDADVVIWYTPLLDLTQVILDLGGRENLERLVGAHDAHLDVGVIHGTLETLLEGQQSRVDRILQLQVVVVALLEEGLRVDHVLADGAGFPGEVRPARVDLVELRPIMVEAREQKRHAKGPHASPLRELLHDGGELSHKHRHRDHFSVNAVIGLRTFAALAHEHSEVGAHP